MKRNGFTLIEVVIVMAIVGIIFFWSMSEIPPITIFPHYSSGMRTGVVYKIGEKGFFWKTWEGEMNVGGMSSDGNGIAIPVVWSFSVKEKSVVDDLIRSAEKGARVTVRYDQAFIRKFTEGESPCLAIGIFEQ